MGSNILRIGSIPGNKVFPLIWIGWSLTLLFLQIVNIFLPINAYISIPILVFGLFSAFLFFKKENSTGTLASLPRVYLVLLGILTVWIAVLSMSSAANYDSGLYHFNSIRWLNESPIVLGLGNLHGRLAFNQSFFSYVAYLNIFPLFEHGYNFANSFLLLTLLADCLYYLSKYVSQKIRTKESSITNIVAIIFIPVLIYLAGYKSLSSPTPDIISSIFNILLFIYFIRFLEQRSSDVASVSQIIFFFLISATAITVKLSNLFYVLSLCLILFYIARKSLFESPKQVVSILVKLLAVPAFIIIVWCLRGFMLSGCPAYPSTIGCIKFHWSVPLQSVKSEADWIYSWARYPNMEPEVVLSSWDWLSPWFFRVIWANFSVIVYPIITYLVGVLVAFLLYVRQPDSRKIFRNLFFVSFPILIGLLSWFLLAPELRFANALFWILPVSASYMILAKLSSLGKLNNVIIIVIFLLLNANIASIIIKAPRPLTNLQTEGYIPIKEVNLVARVTKSGLEILTPVEGDQCWDSKIPCTPYFNNRLKFIDRSIFPEFSISK